MKVFRIVISLIVILAISLCVILFFAAPKILNSSAAIKKYEQILSEKTGVDVFIDGFKFVLHKNLAFDITVSKIEAKDKNTQIIYFNNVEFHSRIFAKRPDKLNIETIYLDFEKLKPKLDKNKKAGGGSLNINYLPVINIREAFVRFDDKSNIRFKNVHSEKVDGTVFCALTAYLTVPYSPEPIIIGEDGYLYFTKDVNFEDFTLRYKNSKLNLSGTINNLNFNGKDLSVYDLKNFFVFFYHTKHNGKRNFIENFTNMTGSLDVDLNFSKKGLSGKCFAHNLKADFSKYKIPVSLPYVRFNFNGRDMRAAATGTFGGEKVYTDVWLKGIATKSVDVKGNVKSKLSANFTKKYFEPVQIQGLADAAVKYHTHDGKVDIEYILGVAPDSNLVSKFGSLNNTDKYRQISAKTLKIADKLYLKSYDYSFLNNAVKEKLLLGDGLFEKISGHFKPAFFSLNTNGKVPVLLVESFVDDYLKSGTFDGSLKYDFKKKIVNGKFSLYDTHHEDFMYIKQADVSAINDKLNVNINGSFFNSPITMKLVVANRFKRDILIDDIDINLDRFNVKRGNISTVKTSFQNSQASRSQSKKGYNFDVKKGKIRVGQIYHPKFFLHDVEILGSLHNNIVDFTIPETEYASGLLSAVGKYNVKRHSSDIHFLASDINSNEVATKIFNLPNQFEGTGFATLHLKTKNKLNNIHAHATFAIEDGFLPKLGSREIIINASNKKTPLLFLKRTFKFTLSKITNIDFSKPNVFYSDLNGSFILDDSCVHNVKIFSQSDYLSLFLSGHYDISSQIGDIAIWGKHDKVAERKIKIFKIPLSIIYKLVFRKEHSKELNNDMIKQIPSIKADMAQTGLFRVRVKGNLNADKLDIDFKDIR